MGGCASQPKDLDLPDEADRPVEMPANAEETAAAASAGAAEDKKDNASSGSNDQSQDEVAPLVDLSKPKEDEADTKAADEAVLVIPGDAKIVVENPKGETVEVEVNAKEGEIIYVEAVKETKEEKKEEAKEEKKEEAVKEEKKVEQTTETAAAATSEDKKE